MEARDLRELTLLGCLSQTSEREERFLAETIAKLEGANLEVDGDADSEEEDNGMGDMDVEGGGIAD